MITQDSKQILISDDSLDYRSRLFEILVSAGHIVRFVVGEDEVISLLEREARGLDLIILGMSSNGEDCGQILRWIRDKGYGESLRSLVVVDGKISVDLVERIKGLGAAGLIPRDFPPEQFIFRVNRALYPDKLAQGVGPRGRVNISLPVEYVFADSELSGKLLNISPTGTYLHTETEILVGTGVSIRLKLPGSDRVIDIDGKVTRTTADSDRKSLFSGCGIEFTSISKDDTQALSHYIDREMKRLGIEATA